MAGRKQHYIPQQLMRGFTVMRGKTEGLFLYRLGNTGAAPVNMADANSIRYFYSGPEDTTLDDSITEAECNEFGHALHKARARIALQPADERTLRRFVAHLVIRTESTRTMATELMARSIDAAEATMTNADVVSELIQNNPDEAGGWIDGGADAAFSELAKQGVHLSPAQKAAAKARLLQAVSARPREVGHEAVQGVRGAVATMPRPTADGASLQRQALAKNLVPPISLAEFESCSLSLEPVAEDLILGDDPVLAFSARGALQRIMLHDDPPALYCLPLTPRLLLTLRRPDAPPLPSAASLNLASAASSRKQFVARDDRDEFLALLGEIDTFRSEGERMDVAAHLRAELTKKR